MASPNSVSSPPVSAELRERAEQHLRALVGSETATLRDDQWTAIESLVVDRRRALVVQKTGWGKSAVYFVATLLLREAGAGPTVIISPLLALMRNQIEAAERAGIRAVTINSTNAEQWGPTHAAIAAGEVDVLLISPERLNNPGFRVEVLPQLAADAGLVVIDEAHCISDWGHDFRPDYRRIRTLLDELPPGSPVLATTATANQRVTLDVAEQLAANDAQALVQRGSLDRLSLRLGVLQLATSEQRLAWLADHLRELPGSGIIYCLTVAATQEVAQHLREAGYEVAAYSGQTEAEERGRLEADLVAGRVKALVATSALGMGFDASLGFVINLGAPASPVAYYQQVGRAGRGAAAQGQSAMGDGALVILMPQREDKDIWAYFASLAFPPEATVRQTLEVLATSATPMSTATLESYVELSRTRLEAMLKVLDVDGAVRRVQGGWTATGQPWSYDAERYARVAAAREAERDAMLAYLATDECRMTYLRRQLDDPDLAEPDLADPDLRSARGAESCGRCDNCGGLTIPTAIDATSVSKAHEALVRPGVEIAPRKQWPTALANLGIDLKGRIAPAAQPGRAVARLTDLGHGQSLRELFALNPDGTAKDQPVPIPLVRAVVEVLTDWRQSGGLPASLAGIAYVDSARRPTLVRDLAEGLARYLQLPIVARSAIQDDSVPPEAGSSNSAQRVAAVRRRFALEVSPEVGSLGGPVRGPVLLVDDLINTGWTTTCAAQALGQAGATQVHPLTLGVVS